MEKKMSRFSIGFSNNSPVNFKNVAKLKILSHLADAKLNNQKVLIHSLFNLGELNGKGMSTNEVNEYVNELKEAGVVVKGEDSILLIELEEEIWINFSIGKP
jgi:hypothetical protein